MESGIADMDNSIIGMLDTGKREPKTKEPIKKNQGNSGL